MRRRDGTEMLLTAAMAFGIAVSAVLVSWVLDLVGVLR